MSLFFPGKGTNLDSHDTPAPPPSPPPLAAQIWSLATALKDFVADGLQTVASEQYATRLEICDTCDQRSGNRCMNCGCLISFKAKARAWTCPLKKWPAVENSAPS